MSGGGLRKVVLTSAAVFGLSLSAAGPARLPKAAGPDPLDPSRLLGAVIAKADGPVQIAYVHGMRAEDAGASEYMRDALQRHYKLGAAPPRLSRCFIDLGPRPEGANYVGQPIWRSDEEWLASRPFIDRYEFRLGSRTVLVDEVNWWPMLFPLKCRFLLEPEHRLSGNDRKHLKMCAEGPATGRAGKLACDTTTPTRYPWIDPKRVKQLLASRPPSGGGAWPNAPVKRQIMNWGLSDAVIALGPVAGYFRQAMDHSFGAARQRAPVARRVIMAESLGSFVVLDALRTRLPQVERFVSETADLYFFANQFALLELARIELVPPSRSLVPQDALTPVGPASSPLSALSDLPLSAPEGLLAGSVAKRQIIAFSDPSDMLTWPVPPIKDVNVVNFTVRHSGGPLRLFASPIKAHRGAITDKAVWRMLLKTR